MQSKKIILITMASLFFFSACGYDVVLEPIDSKKKFVYNVFLVPPDSQKKLTEPAIQKESLKKPSTLKKLTKPVIPKKSLKKPSISREYSATEKWSDQIVLPYKDIQKKKKYIQNTKNTLKLFASIADNAHKDKEGLSVRKELCREARKYVEIYVKSILSDSEAIQHLETKLEIAKLHLLTVMLYFDLALYDQAQNYLNLINERYGNDLAFLGTTIDQTDIGFSTLAEGVKDLQDKILLQTKGRKRAKKSNPQ